MMNEANQKRVNELEQKVRDLQSQLTCSSSPIGDWKVAKCMEYQTVGLDAPYDVEELHNARQAVRDQINEIQAEIASLTGGVVAASV